MLNQVLKVILLALSISSCTATSSRHPAAAQEDSYIVQIQKIDLETANLSNANWEIDQKILKNESMREQMDSQLATEYRKKKGLIDAQLQHLAQNREQLLRQLSSKVDWNHYSGLEPLFRAQFNQPQAEREEIITFENLDFYALNRNMAHPYPLEHRESLKYVLKLINLTPKNTPGYDGTPSYAQFKARFECNGNIIRDEGFLFKSVKSSPVYEFDWYNNDENAFKVKLSFGPEVSECRFRFRPIGSSEWTHGLDFRSIELVSPSWQKFSRQIEVCAKPNQLSGDGVDAFFWQLDFNHVTCPRSFGKITQLRDPRKAVNAKIRNLTGSDLPPSVLDAKDPMAVLDIKNSPSYDIIWVSSLNFSADFYGTTLAKALMHHADAGTQIRILIPQPTTTKKDLQLLKGLMDGHPNVKLQIYEYVVTNGKDGNWIDEWHRVMHAKLLIGYSASRPENNFFITGGRNIRDSYLFRDKPFFKKFPWLKDYASGEEPFIYYDDFEVEVRGSSITEGVLAQMISLWSRNELRPVLRSTNINVPVGINTNQVAKLIEMPAKMPVARHILSLPYVDGGQLERFYVGMLDAAKREVLITTPYFRPTDMLSQAFDRAVKRGVKIRVLTRIKLAGDGTPKIVEDVNKNGVNRHLADLDIYEWTDPNSIMHAKLMVVDERLMFVSSVNLNVRSFTHDVESGILVLHEPSAKNLKAEILNYFSSATRISERRKVSWFNSLLLDFADSYF